MCTVVDGAACLRVVGFTGLWWGASLVEERGDLLLQLTYTGKQTRRTLRTRDNGLLERGTPSGGDLVGPLGAM